MKNLVCVCCGSELTAPQFFNGKMYGYSCIKKVSPQKRVKNTGDFFAPAEVEYIQQDGTTRYKAVATIDNGASFAEYVYYNPITGLYSGNYIVAGTVKLVSGFKPTFRSVSVNTERDGKGKLIISSVITSKGTIVL